jgi:serine/threonine-protein kinase
MILSYCLNPSCSQPQNPPTAKTCQNCGTNLILHNRYRAIKKIGKGGFGATFLAVDLSLPGNPLCVVKQLRPSSDDPDAYEMALELFEREAKTLGKIDHPQIPRLLDFFEEAQQFYLVQTLVKGKNLQQEVKQNGVFLEIGAKRFLAEILPVLQYVHSMNIIHRDLKPANIIRREQDGQLVLIDFGAVKDQVNTQLAKTYGQTALTQFSVGTVGFSPPEQLAMRPIYASDIYALGATCLYLMTAKSPKDFLCDDDTGELLWEQEVRVSPTFAKILRKMLEIDVRNRYKSAAEVMKDLDMLPYEQELQQSLFTNTSVNTPDNTPQTSGESSQTAYTSATARLAMAIRARKSRQTKGPIPAEMAPEGIIRAHAQGKNDFSKQKLNNLNLPQANLNQANFRHSQLVGANFEEAELVQANFYNANLNHANLRKANLQQAYLFKSDLQNADFRGANLEDANLLNANLKNANLCAANLTNAKVEDQQLEQAKTNWQTIFPDGKRRFWH